MAYLDNSTITVDAILTKKGRERLAEGRDNFKIVNAHADRREFHQSINAETIDPLPSIFTLDTDCQRPKA